MKISIIGTGHIGKILVKRLSGKAHEVKVANSRGPETIDADILSSGGRAVTAQDAVTDVDVVILSIPLNRIPEVAPLVASLPPEVTVIDTSNYFPQRDGHIDAIDAGQVESLWVAERLGRPIAKAWNTIGSQSLATKAQPAGHPDRVAIPVAADSEHDRQIAMALVDDTGIEPVDAGTLAESWRQQPGSPVYCTDLSKDELAPALSAADRARLPKRRDLSFAAVMERIAGTGATNPDAQYSLRLHRALFL